MKVLCVSEDCLNFCSDAVGVAGEVHSVFERAVNLIFPEGTLVSLVSDQGDLAPMTCQIERRTFTASGWVPGMPAMVTSQGLRVGQADLNLSEARVWSLASPNNNADRPLERARMIQRLERFTELLVKMGKADGLLPFLCESLAIPRPKSCQNCSGSNRYVDFIEGRLDQFISAYRDPSNRGEAKALEAFSRLVGFGPGLTPSTDDFVAGFMAASLRCPYGRPMERERLIERHLKFAEGARGKTTTVSEAMLIHAARGHVAEKYRALLDLLCFDTEDAGRLEQATLNALANGDTSGADFLTGAAISLMSALNTHEA